MIGQTIKLNGTVKTTLIAMGNGNNVNDESCKFKNFLKFKYQIIEVNELT